MNINKKNGFTLIETMAVIAILGILGATAIPTYHAWLQRARGSEAKLMAKQILDAEITYYLDKDSFFPGPGETIEVMKDYSPNHVNITTIADKLHITIQPGHSLDYVITNDPDKEELYLTISSDFEIFKGGIYMVVYTLDKNGKIYDPVPL
jgi:prepilin-type N-terminal cleavage/methylation domain-containing protein